MNFFNGQCLIAMPGMSDKRFDHSIVFVCAHTAEGAMGLVINRPQTDLNFDALVEQLHIEKTKLPTQPCVLAGGPVDTIRGFVLHSPDYTGTGTLPINALTSLTVTTEILREIAVGKGPKNSLILLGYAGWGAGQLENEIKENAWLPIEASSDLLYKLTPDKKWKFALEKLGIDPLRLSSEQGKA